MSVEEGQATKSLTLTFKIPIKGPEEDAQAENLLRLFHKLLVCGTIEARMLHESIRPEDRDKTWPYVASILDEEKGTMGAAWESADVRYEDA